VITDVFATVAIGAGILTASGMIAARRRLELPVWRTLPLFCSMAAWMTPMVAFYKRDSLWAVAASFVFSAFGSRLIYRYHLASSARDIASAEPQAELFHARRLISLVFAALLLQVGALSLLASLAQPATVLIGGAIIVISFFHQTATPLNQSQRRPQIPTATLRFSISIGLAIILVAASLTPYLAAPTEYARATGTGAANLHSIPKPTGTPAKSKASFLQSAAPWSTCLPRARQLRMLTSW
jgi:hypothetical protein